MPHLRVELAHELPLLFRLRLALVVRTKERQMALWHRIYFL